MRDRCDLRGLGERSGVFSPQTRGEKGKEEGQEQQERRPARSRLTDTGRPEALSPKTPRCSAQAPRLSLGTQHRAVRARCSPQAFLLGGEKPQTKLLCPLNLLSRLIHVPGSPQYQQGTERRGLWSQTQRSFLRIPNVWSVEGKSRSGSGTPSPGICEFAHSQKVQHASPEG